MAAREINISFYEKKEGFYMWEKSREAVKMAKILAELLGMIWQNKEFVTEVLDEIDGDLEKADKLIHYIQEKNPTVPSQIYDALEMILDKKFSQKYNQLAIEKKKAYSVQENTLKKALLTEKIIMVCEWNLSEEEEKQFETAKLGTAVRVKNPPVPILLRDADMGEIIIPIFTSDLEIQHNYRDEKYCVQQVKWSYIKRFYTTIADNMGPVVVLLDMDSNMSLDVTDEMKG